MAQGFSPQFFTSNNAVCKLRDILHAFSLYSLVNSCPFGRTEYANKLMAMKRPDNIPPKNVWRFFDYLRGYKDLHPALKTDDPQLYSSAPRGMAGSIYLI